MSALYPTSPSQSFGDSIWLVAALLSSTSYGIVLTLSVLNFYLVLERYRSSRFKDKRRHHLALLAYICLLFSMCTLLMGSQAEKTRLAFVENRDNPGGPSAYQSSTLSSAVSRMGIAASTMINWLSDGLLLWRCFAFYRSSTVTSLQWVMVPPLSMYVCSLATGIWIDILFAEDASALLRTMTLVYGSMSVGLNVLLTCMIIVRLSILRRNIAKCLGPASTSQYTSIMAMLIESASIFSFVVVLYLIPFGMKSMLSIIPTLSMTQIQAIASLMIIFRVAQGTTEIMVEDVSQQHRTGLSTIRFTQSTSRSEIVTDVGETPLELALSEDKAEKGHSKMTALS